MDKPIDHQRCSELLSALLTGRLSAPEAAAVEEHLSGCEECRAERTALEFLGRAEPEEPLTARERSALESGVMAGLAKETGEQPVVVPMGRRKPIGQRAAQVLGAAATIAVLGSLVYFGTSSGGDDSSGGSAETASTAEEAAEAPLTDRDMGKGRRSGGGQAGGSASQGTLESSAADTAAGTGFKAPTPSFTVEDDPYTSGDLQKLGESSLASVTFANSYRASDTDGRLTLLEQLVDHARGQAGDEVAEQVERCGRQVLDTEDPAIPTFGSIGELDGRNVLVLGFAWTRSSSGPLDRYMVWAWERGSCDVAVDFVDGRIGTQN